MPDFSPETKTRTAVTVDVGVYGAYAHGLANHPDSGKLTGKALIYSEHLRRPSLIGKLCLPFDAVNTLSPRRYSVRSVEVAADEAIAEAKAANSQCELTDPTVATEQRIVTEDPRSVTFTCTAANCCQEGLVRASQELRGELRSAELELTQLVNASSNPL